MRTPFLTTLAFAFWTSAALLGLRQTTLPSCLSCLNTGLNNTFTGNCSGTDLACLCASQAFVQSAVNCLAATCSDVEDVNTVFQDLIAYCEVAGVNTLPAVTTPAIAATQTSQPSEETTFAAPISSTTSHSGTSASPKSSPNIAVIVAPIVSVVVIAAALLAAILCFQRRTRRRAKMSTESAPQFLPSSPGLVYSDPLPATYPSPPTTYQAPSIFNESMPEPVPYTITSYTESQGDPTQSPPFQERSLVTSPPPPSIMPYGGGGGPPTYRSRGPNSLMPAPDTFMPSFVDPERDEIGRFAEMHRDVISYELEDKLRRSGYKPADDPKEMPIEVWVNQYGIGHFEVKRLQEIYDSTGGK